MLAPSFIGALYECFQALNPLVGLVYALGRDVAALNHGAYYRDGTGYCVRAVDEIVADQDDIHARSHGQFQRILERVVRGDGAHQHVVRDTTPSKPMSSRSKPVRILCESVAGSSKSRCELKMCAVIIR